MINGYFALKNLFMFMIISRLILLGMRNILDTFIEEINTYFIIKAFSKNLMVYEIMWKNTVEPERPQMTI
jgi:hypothetical protein